MPPTLPSLSLGGPLAPLLRISEKLQLQIYYRLTPDENSKPYLTITMGRQTFGDIKNDSTCSYPKRRTGIRAARDLSRHVRICR